jgi:hypothetical protein
MSIFCRKIMSGNTSATGLRVWGLGIAGVFYASQLTISRPPPELVPIFSDSSGR